MCNPIIFIKFILFKNGFDIIVQVDGEQPVLANLNPKEKLSNVRASLEKNSLIKMDSKLLFTKKGGKIYKAADEEKKTLENVIGKKKKILHLTRTSFTIPDETRESTM